METNQYIQFHLDRVSRSFALAIRLLQQPLCQYVGTAYLLFRALDTIEDSAWQSRDDQESAYRLFLSVLDGQGEKLQDIATLKNLMAKSKMSKEESELFNSLETLIGIFKVLPEKIRSLTQSRLAAMAFGMQSFGSNGKLHLQSIKELDLYCYFVAGVVGELLTEFLAHEVGRVPESLRHKAIPFGLFLQKVNILKDRGQDAREGRNFEISRQTILASLKSHADEAFGYLKAIPRSRPDFVTFCALSYFLGLTAITMVAVDVNAIEPVKPSRDYTMNLLGDIQKTLNSNGDFSEIQERIIRSSQIE